jgi:hypothetical protein
MFIGVVIRGVNAFIPMNKPKKPARLKGSRARLSKKLCPVDPSPAIPVVPEVEVTPRPFRSSESRLDNDVDGVDDAAGDARFCSVEVIVELSWDSADCTPLPVAVPLA